MKILVGTSGFQYPEWKGKFYPEDLSVAKMLPYYADRFATTEINYSFRQTPSSKTIEKWDALTPKNFIFSLKAPQKITHFAKLRYSEESLRFFVDAISPLGSKLGSILFQLPPTFKKDTAVLADFLQIIPPDLRAAFEFRDASWFDEEVFALLRKFNKALCLAESEDLVTPREATASYGYLRLRREDYSKADLRQWAKFVQAQKWKDTFVYFKHEERGVGPEFAQAFLGDLAG